MSVFKREKQAEAPDEAALEPAADGIVAKPKRSKKRVILTVVIVLLVIVLVGMGWLFYTGALAPWYAAAKYDGMHYITEQEVEDYIDSYQVQQGYEDATDEQWAVYLAYYGLTPETLRQSVIQQLVTTEMIEKAAKEADVEITDEEWETYATNIKNNLAFGDDEVYEETIEAQGQTVEEFEASYRNMLLRQRLYEAVVEVPEATDEETLSYISSTYTEETTTKHIYYFTLEGLDEDGGYEDLQYMQEIWQDFQDEGMSAENFEIMVGSYSEDDDLIETGGAYGWDLDIDDYSDSFQEAVEYTEVGEVSEVFSDDEGYAFVYIDTSYTIEVYDEDDPYELADFPESLQAYFADCAAYELWDDDCNEYLLSLYTDSNCIIYAMPEDASYNVDMDLATEYAEEQMEEEESSGEDESSQESDVESSSEDDTGDDSDEGEEEGSE